MFIDLHKISVLSDMGILSVHPSDVSLLVKRVRVHCDKTK